MNFGSKSAVGVQGTPTYSDSSGIFLPKTTGVDPQGAFVDVLLNVKFDASATASGLAAAAVIAFAFINGETAASCGIRSGGVVSCDSSPVHVALGSIVSTSLFLNAAIFANANGQLEDAVAVANGSGAFSFVIGGPVLLRLPDDCRYPTTWHIAAVRERPGGLRHARLAPEAEAGCCRVASREKGTPARCLTP